MRIVALFGIQLATRARTRELVGRKIFREFQQNSIDARFEIDDTNTVGFSFSNKKRENEMTNIDAILESKAGSTVSVCVDDGATNITYDSQILLAYDGDNDTYLVVRRWSDELDVLSESVTLERAASIYRTID